jgi:hypothetical protein
LSCCSSSRTLERCNGSARAVIETYQGFPHGMPTTQADTITADLLAFVQS